MRPIILKGHQRPLTTVLFNREGDLLFTAAKDYSPCVWFSSTGERIGTYDGHTGAVYHLDVNWDSTLLATASADASARLWDVNTGEQLFQFGHKCPVRCVQFATGDRMLLTVGDKAMKQEATVYIYPLADDSKDQEDKYAQEIKGHEKKVHRALWTDCNEKIITCSDDGTIRKWDVETAAELESITVSKKPILNMQYNHDKTMLILGCADMKARLYDTKSLKFLKEFASDRPINAAAINPVYPLINMGGGQDAMSVTTTRTDQGKFEVDFYHCIFEDFVGSVKGHFGPVNALDFARSGKTYASGGEDGYVRLHHFDPSFLDMCEELDGRDFW